MCWKRSLWSRSEGTPHSECPEWDGKPELAGSLSAVDWCRCLMVLAVHVASVFNPVKRPVALTPVACVGHRHDLPIEEEAYRKALNRRP